MPCVENERDLFSYHKKDYVQGTNRPGQQFDTELVQGKLGVWRYKGQVERHIYF